jgi:hypothetical protein
VWQLLVFVTVGKEGTEIKNNKTNDVKDYQEFN